MKTSDDSMFGKSIEVNNSVRVLTANARREAYSKAAPIAIGPSMPPSRRLPVAVAILTLRL